MTYTETIIWICGTNKFWLKKEIVIKFKDLHYISKQMLKRDLYEHLVVKCKWPSQESSNMGLLYVFALFSKPTASMHLTRVLLLCICQLNYTRVLLCFWITIVSKYFYLWNYLCIMLLNFQKQIRFAYLQNTLGYRCIWVYINFCSAHSFFNTASDIHLETNMVHRCNLFKRLTFTYFFYFWVRSLYHQLMFVVPYVKIEK